MSTINDRVRAGDGLTASLIQGDRVVAWPCPECGLESKASQDGFRICASRTCRHEFEMEAPLFEAVAEFHSDGCPKCNKPLKEHHGGKKICSMRTCRHIVG